MTVIAARKIDGNIHFAADQQTTAGWRKVGAEEAHLGKLFSINGMVIGSAGLRSTSLMMAHFARNHCPAEATEVDVASFVLEFIEWMTKRTPKFELKNCFIIAFRGELFKVYDGLDTFAVPEFASIGSGQDFALAAMHLGHSPKEAAKVAAKLDVHCSGEIDTMIHKPVMEAV